MGKVISTINLKGGVGKTTTTAALAEFLSAEFRKKVLVIDLDPQTNLTTVLIGEEKWKELNDAGFTLASLFTDALRADTDPQGFASRRGPQCRPSSIFVGSHRCPGSAGLDAFWSLLLRQPDRPAS